MSIIDWKKEKIKGVLSTFDRIIIKGYSLQLCNIKQMAWFLSYNNILLKDFGDYALKTTESLCNHIEDIAIKNNRPYKFIHQGEVDKGEYARQILIDNPVKDGLVCILSGIEVCSTMNVVKNGKDKKLEMKWNKRKCKYYYLYFIDKDFGWMHVKVQSWFPFMIQIYINGREYLSKQLDKENIKYEMFNNCFVSIDDINRAQELADNLTNIKISDKFDEIIEGINNFLPKIKETFNHSYYWCLAECEYATDIMFDNRAAVEEFFPELVEKAFYVFKCNDVMSFFGRKLLNSGFQFEGEMTSDLRKRAQGYRLKHKMKSNQIKMYDKQSVIRIETTINDPKEFKILKEKTDDTTGEVITSKKWVPMGKSIANMYRYAEVSKAINNRYIEALPIPIEKGKVLKEIQNISQRKVIDEKVYTGFNINQINTLRLFEILADASLVINGFTNKIISERYFDNIDKNSSHKMTRILNKLKKHGIIKKVRSASKYYLTNKGREILNYVFLFNNKEIQECLIK